MYYNAFYKDREKEEKKKSLEKRWERKKKKNSYFLHLLEYMGFRKNQMLGYKIDKKMSAYIISDFIWVVQMIQLLWIW